MYQSPAADGKCAIEPYLQPGALRAYNTPRGFNQAANRLNQDCVNDELDGGTIYGTGMLRYVAFIQFNDEHVMSIY